MLRYLFCLFHLLISLFVLLTLEILDLSHLPSPPSVGRAEVVNINFHIHLRRPNKMRCNAMDKKKHN